MRDCDLFEIFGVCLHRFNLNIVNHIQAWKVEKIHQEINNEVNEKNTLRFENFEEKIFEIKSIEKDQESSRLLVKINREKDTLLLKGDNDFEFKVRWVYYIAVSKDYQENPGAYAMSMDNTPFYTKLSNLRFSNFSTNQ